MEEMRTNSPPILGSPSWNPNRSTQIEGLTSENVARLVRELETTLALFESVARGLDRSSVPGEAMHSFDRARSFARIALTHARNLEHWTRET